MFDPVMSDLNNHYAREERAERDSDDDKDERDYRAHEIAMSGLANLHAPRDEGEAWISDLVGEWLCCTPEVSQLLADAFNNERLTRDDARLRFFVLLEEKAKAVAARYMEETA